MKSLKDIDRTNSFYSDKGDKAHKALLKQLESEERGMVEENRRRYKNRNKGVKDDEGRTERVQETQVRKEKEPSENPTEQMLASVEPSSQGKSGQRMRGVRRKKVPKRPSRSK